MNNDIEEVYFVLSGDCPNKICFDRTCFDSKGIYIDSFDKDGNHVKAYQDISDDEVDPEPIWKVI